MDEFWMYSWQDKWMYEGFYKDDKKNGFDVYTWSDKKRYSGWRSNGKQHGIGVFLSHEGKRRLDVLEDGKKLRWLTIGDINLVETGSFEIIKIDKLVMSLLDMARIF